MNTAQIIEKMNLDTDKNDPHSYCDQFYDKEFPKYKDKPISLLEIGVWVGGSLVLWDQYFQNAESIVGVDNGYLVFNDDQKYTAESYKNMMSNRVKIVNADAYAPETADNLGMFDIIIDDGQHWLNYQVKSLQLYLPHLKDGGIMIVEDVMDESVDDIASVIPPLLPTGATLELMDFRRLVKGRHADILLVIRKATDAH